MKLENGKSAVPIPSVGADGEQPIPKNSEISIAESDLNSNPLEHDFDEMFWRMQQLDDPAYLHTVSMRTL